MSKEYTQEELNLLIKEATDSISSLMKSLAISNDNVDKKKSSRIASWVKRYVMMLRKEKTFDPKSLPRYKRGQLLLIDFGFRIGSEIGGLHYAVVLDSHNYQASPLITVVPLKSKKEGQSENSYSVNLPDGIFFSLNKKMRQLTDTAMQLQAESESNDISPEEAKAKRSAARALTVQANSALNELTQLKLGSVANVGQVCTVSKIRIVHPLFNADPLFDVKATDADMKIIDARVSKLYSVNC